jgi:cell division protein FtsB
MNESEIRARLDALEKRNGELEDRVEELERQIATLLS